MSETENKPMIYGRITSVMKEIGAVKKDSRNQQQGFLYRGVDAVMNALNPALIHNRIFAVPQVLEQTREERTTGRGAVLIYSVCRVKYTFYAEDRSFVEAVVVGEGMDSGDKATNKALSAAFKYACFQVFCIPTEEMYDPDADSPQPATYAAAEGNARAAADTAANSTEGKASAAQTGKTRRGSGSGKASGGNTYQKNPAAGNAGSDSTAMEGSSGITGQETAVPAGTERIDAIKIATLHGELQRTGVGERSMCNYYQVASVEELTTEQFISAMNRLKQLPDRGRANA
ncbi:MAG: ERF family protein [Lachnospiraceae bacterium]|nr:ERF family protein [Lachnospiraceae bacterium]